MLSQGISEAMQKHIQPTNAKGNNALPKNFMDWTKNNTQQVTADAIISGARNSVLSQSNHNNSSMGGGHNDSMLRDPAVNMPPLPQPQLKVQ